jgi:hypothetical protein
MSEFRYDRQAMHEALPLAMPDGPSVDQRDQALRTLVALAVRKRVEVPELLDLARMLGLVPDKL